MPADTALTPEQIDHFADHGYLVCETVFRPDEVAACAAAYDACLGDLRYQNRLANIRPGARDDGTPTRVYQIRCAHLAHPRSRRAAHRP